MKLLATSDIHGKDITLEKYNEFWPGDVNNKDYDVFMIAGDIVPLQTQRDIEQSKTWLSEEFVPMCHRIMDKCGARKVVFVGGNHDFALESMSPSDFDELAQDDKIVYLRNNYIDFEGLTIYGISDMFMYHWAYNVPNEKALKNVYNAIPSCDVLLTHCPPFGLPQAQERSRYDTLELLDFGNKALRNLLEDDVHFFGSVVCGHIHDGLHGKMVYNGSEIYNVSFVDDDYMANYKMETIVFDNK